MTFVLYFNLFLSTQGIVYQITNVNKVPHGHNLGLNRTGHMSFLTGQNRTPKFAKQDLPDWTESRVIFLNILPTKYRLSILIR